MPAFSQIHFRNFVLFVEFVPVHIKRIEALILILFTLPRDKFLHPLTQYIGRSVSFHKIARKVGLGKERGQTKERAYEGFHMRLPIESVE